MSWITSFFTSSIGGKILMAASGLFLTLFLIVHLSGNLQLLATDGRAFNEYANFMGHNPLIQAGAVVNFSIIILHFIMAIKLTLDNRKSRPVRYEVTNKSSSWASRNMFIFGGIIFVFLLIHLSSFWYQGKFGTMAQVNYEGGPMMNDMYSLVHAKFSQPLYLILYVGTMLFVAFHLWHGFQSAFQSIGIRHAKYTPIIKTVGYGITVLVALGFAAIPIIIFLRHLG